VAGSLAGKFFPVCGPFGAAGINSHCNSNALHAKSRISSLIGAGNFHCQGREFQPWGQGILTRDALDGFLKAHDVFEPYSLGDLERERRDLRRLGF
jgi:hypothetical protein